MMQLSPSCRLALTVVTAAVALAACASESHRTLPTGSVTSRFQPYAGPKHKLVIGNFQNRSPYMRGIFSSGVDRLGGQAKTILATHLSQSGRFTLVDRGNMDEIAREAKLAGAQQQIIGAEILVTGQVVEFGRRTTGDKQLFGILGRGKKQTAYAKVSLNIVDVRTSQVIHSVQGAGEYGLSSREVIGFGSTASYDSTLNGKVLNLAIADAVEKLVDGLQTGAWSLPRAQ